MEDAQCRQLFLTSRQQWNDESGGQPMEMRREDNWEFEMDVMQIAAYFREDSLEIIHRWDEGPS